ncbi:MAG TPA: FtsX-like permease family protein [Candidatus Scatomorpha pullistercoris]|uniref:FtsX-like permease family protein n=1 Tax=Candidatus Scatomorpha pullistercoris TaxID=2840929 RepID=A0A9D1K9B2_9FIRM|nr:FtsX-like permease family protein [Candidatus Scatomorpha pullistercoris]
MRKLSFYPKLAARSMKSNRRFYVPYLLTVIGTAAAFYIMAAIVFDPGTDALAAGTTNGPVYVSMFMTLGMFVLGLFSCIFLLYTNSFLMKRRQKELGLYSVLGMSKTNIAGIMVFESLYIGLIGIGGGLAVGILLHKLVSLLLFRLMRLPVPFGFSVQPIAILIVVLFFAGLILLTLITNLARVGLSKPIELLRGGNVGEKEPKASWFLTTVGILTLGAGYVVATLVDNPGMAVAVYFLAVFAVIIGTYCLFTSVSIAVLKALRRNKRYYYKAKHFISVSGMLYRMKRNAVGLANICILCTMVMVMVSGTLSLYLGSAEQVNAYCPADVVVETTYYASSNEDHVYNDETGEETIEHHTPYDAAAMDAWFEDYFAGHRLTPSSASAVEYYEFTAEVPAGGIRRVMAVSAETYAQLTGEPVPELAAGEALAHVPSGYGQLDALSFLDRDGGTVSIGFAGEAKLTAVQVVLNRVAVNWSEEDDEIVLVVPDRAALLELVAGQENGSYVWRGQYDFEASDEALAAMVDDYFAASREDEGADAGYYDVLRIDLRSVAEQEVYGLSGGFLFLGVFLGIVFLMATVLIIYYKQVSEGYEDNARFDIMRKVGLSEREARRAIRSQILTVFFMPILVAAVHIAFDFNLVVQLLRLFSLTNMRLTALCTLGTLLVFCAVYAIVYALTARSYYKIVRPNSDNAR